MLHHETLFLMSLRFDIGITLIRNNSGAFKVPELSRISIIPSCTFLYQAKSPTLPDGRPARTARAINIGQGFEINKYLRRKYRSLQAPFILQISARSNQQAVFVSAVAVGRSFSIYSKFPELISRLRMLRLKYKTHVAVLPKIV
jgi:hypothetical protein